MISGVQHAGEVLDLFTVHTPEWGPTGVARALGLSKSHAHRLLSSLAGLGLLERQPTSGRYRLGRSSLALAAVVLGSDEVISRALPAMRSLHERTAADVVLAVRDREHVICVRPGSETFLIGPDTADCCALATVLRAQAPPPERVRNSDALLARLRYVRSVAIESCSAGHCCAVAPILDRSGSVVAALSIEVAPVRWQAHRHDLIRQLRAAAVRLTANLTLEQPPGTEFQKVAVARSS